MLRTDQRTNVFHIDRIVKTSLGSFGRNVLLWLLLAVVVDIVSMRFAEEFHVAVVSYMSDRFHFDPDLSGLTRYFAELPSELLPPDKPLETVLRDAILAITSFFAFITLLQAILSQLIFDAVDSQRSKISLEEAASFFGRESFVLNLLRVISVTMCYYLLVILLLVLFLGTVVLTPAVTGSGNELLARATIVVAAAVVVLVLMYIAIRWSLAIPVAVVEEKSVFRSIARSWRLTKSCWLTVGVIVIILVGQVVLAMAIEIGIGVGVNGAAAESITRFLFEVAGMTLTTIVLAVCYYYVHETWEGTEDDAEGGSDEGPSDCDSPA